MADERSSVAHPPAAADDEVGSLDELEVLEELVEDKPASSDTGQRLRPPSAPTSAGRASVPPPVPKDARGSRPPGSLPPPSLGRAPGFVVEAGSGTLPRSGMFRIEREAGSVPPAPPTTTAAGIIPAPARASTAPPPPSGASDVAGLKRTLAALSSQLRDNSAQIHRLRLMVKLREDRIRELEAASREQQARADALAAELAALRAQRTADDLKRIAGIGPGFERALHGLGVTTFRQIADWTPADVQRVAAAIRTTPRRILRDDWIGRARAIACAEEQGEA